MARGFNSFGRGMRMPNGGGRELNDFTSWKTVSTGLAHASEYTRRINKERDKIGEIMAENYAARRNVDYGRMSAGIGGIQGRISGKTGQAVDSSISNFLKKVESAGGANIRNSDLSKAIGELQKNIGRIASQTGGAQGEYLKGFAHDLKEAKSIAAKGGLSAIGNRSKDFIKTAFGLKADNTIDKAKKELASEIRKTANAVSSPHLKQSLHDISRELHRAANAAKTSADKQKAVADADKKIRNLTRMTTNGADRVAVEGLSKSASKKTTELTKSIAGLTKAQKAGELNRRLSNLSAALGTVGKTLVPLKRSLDIGNAVFQAVNSRFNQFARMQMRVSAERAGYGRQIRGAGINFGHMTAALGSGRSAGMDDREIVNQMVGLQGNLARARWGEGPLIENMGKWGLTPFDANGNMKSNHEVMIDYSRKLNSMTDKMEKLQFLLMQGFRPEQMEYVSNYEKFAKRQAYLNEHPNMRGTLEQADYLDESGFSAKADAATKVELRRREVLNQNAIEKGILPGLIRSLSPENWFFSDWTARQQGVASAKSEQAMEKLTEELKNLSDEVRKSGVEIGAGSFSSKETNLSAKELKGLSLSSGWAEASKANFGEKSAVNILKKVVGARSSGVGSDTQKKINRTVGGVTGGIGGGLIGGGLGALAGGLGGAGIGTLGALGIAAATGGLGAIPILLSGAAAGATKGSILGGILGGGAGMIGGGIAGSKVIENTKGFWDFSNDDVKEARKAAKGSDEDWENWKKKTGLTNLKKSQVLDVDFDKESLEGAKVQSLVARASEMAGGKEVNLEALAGDKYLDRMTEGVDEGSKEYEDRVVEALARTADETIGKSEAILRIIQRGVKVTDPDVAKRVDELTQANEANGMVAADAKNAAEQQAVQEVKDNAMKEGDLINRQIEENKKKADEGYQNYVKSKGEMTKDEWYQQNLGDRQQQERRAYNQIYGEGGPMAGQVAPWESLTDTLKNDRINQFLQKKNFGGSKIKGYSDELAGLYDDAIVAKLALENDTSEEEVRQNILSKDKYQELKAKRDNGDKLDGRDEMMMRIYESSNSFKKSKEEENKKKDEEKKTEEEGINDIATFSEAAKMIGDMSIHTDGSGYMSNSAKAREKYGLDSKQQERLMELQTKKDIGGLKSLSEEEQKEYEELEKRKANMGKSKVDRKKLIKLVAANGVDLSRNFSQEEIDAYKQEQAEEKDRFMQGKSHTEGKYELYKDVERRILSGEEVSTKERAMYNKEKRRISNKSARKTSKPLHSEPTISKEAQADIDDALRNGRESKKAFDKNKRKIPLAQMSDMRQMHELESKGMSKEELTRRFGEDRMKQYEKEGKGVKRKRKVSKWTEKELEDSLRSTAEGFKQREGESDEDFKKRKEEFVAEGIRERKVLGKKRKSGNTKKGKAVEAGFSSDYKDNKKTADESDKVGGVDAIAEMRKKTDVAEQAASKMAANGAAAEAAAASAKNAQAGGSASSSEKNITINLGGQTINQNIQGNIPIDADGIKGATEQAGSTGFNQLPALITSIAESKGLI